MADVFQRGVFQPNVFQVSIPRVGGAFTKRPDRRKDEDDYWTKEEIEKYQRKIRLARERAEQSRRDKLQAEQDRLAELVAIYEDITGEARPVVLAKPVKAKPTVAKVKRQNADIEKQVLELLSNALADLDLRAKRFQDEQDDDDAVMLLLA